MRDYNYEGQLAKEALRSKQETLEKIKDQERYEMAYAFIDVVSFFALIISYFVGSTNSILFWEIIFLGACIGYKNKIND